jgi:hypothetical protein
MTEMVIVKALPSRMRMTYDVYAYAYAYGIFAKVPNAYTVYLR